MDDVISRQAAIDGIEKRQMNIMRSTVLLDQMRFDGLADALDIIKLLPTAQPEPFGSIEHAGIEHPLSDREIIPRLRQIQEQVGGSYAIDRIIEIAMSKQPEPCEDAVSRLEIIRNLHKYFKEGFEQDKWWNSGHVIHAIMDAPSVTPKQRTGKWILVERCSVKGHWATCTVCGRTSFGGGKFCRECGAKMEGTVGRD